MGINKETVAVIHYMDGVWERETKVYSLNSMIRMIQYCNKKGFVYYVCLTKMDTIIPVSSHKPVTVFKPSTEYIDKVGQLERQHGAFREPTRIDKIHNQKNREEVIKAYQSHI